MERRKFLQSTGLLTAAFFTLQFPLVAGPFTENDFLGGRFPADKKLDPAWLASLFERGRPTTYTKSNNELRYIGMPVGGICCGCVYLGGDGRLWLWDIFNENQLGVVTKKLPIQLEGFNIKEIKNSEGTLYLEPLTGIRPLQQGFALSIEQNGSTIIKRIHEDDWDEIEFEATYPVATIRYTDTKLALQVTIHAFSPFIPGDAADSGLPATIQSFSLKNLSGENISVKIIGWLQNKMLLNSEREHADFTRVNKVIKDKTYNGISLECTTSNKELEKAPGYGSMMLATLEKSALCFDDVLLSEDSAAGIFKDLITGSVNSPVAGVITTHTLMPGQGINASFIITWYTPNISFYRNGNPSGMTVQDADLRYYSTRFKDAVAVGTYVAQHYPSLKSETLLWKETWYDSTLPWWFLERTFLNISTLASASTHRFQSGRFYAWEGVGCCPGNCTHVYQYAQAMSRIFPGLEKDTRERVDMGIGYEEATGIIQIRGEKTGPSIDGQAGTILRILREHQMSSDNAFLRKNWLKIKKAVVFLMLQDKNKDGMEDTPMENTLDAKWHGEIAWIVGLCIAGVKAGQVMAEEMNDRVFARECREYVEKGTRNMEQYLFNGEYFIHRADPAVGKKEIGSFNTCHIDQVYGQAWAWQVGLGRIISKEKTMSALQALWKYNYMPDVGPYIKVHTGGRFYALAGEGGMIMNTNPANEADPYGKAKAWQTGYFSECMSGFEHQVAAHMMAEGMVQESLVLTKSIHDRYHALKRNPFNEVECSDHYGRAMAAYGTFINACGFTYHGPKGHIGFAPRLTPENFKAPFTVAEGWGTYSQQQTKKTFSAKLKIAHGKLKLKQFSVALHNEHNPVRLAIMLNDKLVVSSFRQDKDSFQIVLHSAQIINAGQVLTLRIT